jgi:hypothetical protein
MRNQRHASPAARAIRNKPASAMMASVGIEVDDALTMAEQIDV